MKRYVPLSLGVVFCLTLCFQTVHADNITSFSFITKPQSILPGALSKEITIQSQNSSSVLESVSETFDLNFSSNSSTGLFLGSTGKAVSKTMSKNTANRTFYYKDNSPGDFVLTVVATGRDSKRSFTTTQHIVISLSQPIIETPIPKKVVSQTQTVVSKPKESNKITVPKTKTLEVSTPSPNEANTFVFTAQKQTGFWSGMFAWPVRFFNFVRRLFVVG